MNKEQVKSKPNVVGYSENPMPRIRAGQEVPGTCCVRVYLSKKVPRDQLAPDDMVPAAIEGTETDCVVIGEVSVASLLPMLSPPTLYTGRWATLISGISIAHGTVTAGTLGCFVRKDGQDYILTNWHVAVGAQGKEGDTVYQPGPYDIQQVYGEGPSEKYAAGTLAAFRVPAQGQSDSALVKPTRAYDPNLFVSPQMAPSPEVAAGHPVWLAGIVDPVVGMKVLKEGRTTGLTRGTVIDTDATLDVNYGGDIGKLTFSHLVVIQGANQPYLQSGDSGSVSREDAGVPKKQAAVGLNFAGSTEGYGMAFKMAQVAQELGFVLAPEAEQPPAPGPAKSYAPSDVLTVAIVIEALVPTKLSFFRTDRSTYREGDAVAIEGRLEEIATGGPVAGVAVRVSWADTVLSLVTDGAGVFRGVLTGLAPGSYTLKAQFLGS